MDAHRPPQSTITRETHIPIGWAIALAIGLCGSYVHFVTTQSNIAHTIDTVNLQVQTNTMVLKDVHDQLRREFITRGELRVLFQRLQDRNAELFVPTVDER